MSRPTTEHGKKAVRMRGLFGGETEARAAQWVAMIEAEAIEAERERIRRLNRVSLNSMPIWSHVDAYGLGQVLKGEPWPENR